MAEHQKIRPYEIIVIGGYSIMQRACLQHRPGLELFGLIIEPELVPSETVSHRMDIRPTHINKAVCLRLKMTYITAPAVF